MRKILFFFQDFKNKVVNTFQLHKTMNQILSLVSNNIYNIYNLFS